MKTLLILSTLFFMTNSFAQDWEYEAPNYKNIEKAIKKKKSNLFYDTLMARYQKGDSTLTLEEKKHLYYGYTFQSGYDPYGDSDYSDSLKAILQKDTLKENDYNQIIRYSDSVLAAFPFDLRTISYQRFALEKIHNPKKLQKRETQYDLIYTAIKSSGHGITKENAFYVISLSHEYEILYIFGFDFGGEQSLTGHYDYLLLAENEAEIEGMYFDVSPCLKHMEEMFKD